MTTSRLAILLAVLLAGLSTVFLLPKQLFYQPLGIGLELPEILGEWWGRPLNVTDKERSVLGQETEFARMIYTNGRGDDIQVSIVLAGQDMNTSIHRPERCLPAQGWTVTGKASRVVAVPAYGTVRTTRLHNLRNITAPDGKLVPVHNVNYYWFVGHTSVTGSHFERTCIDIKDRLLRGYNQRWAYISVSSSVTKDLQRFGRDEIETDALLRSFIGLLVPKIHKASVERS
jgi:EpsI family protein